MRTLIAISFILCSFFSFAQAPSFVVEGASPNLYIAHTVAPKESIYSIARVFNLPPAVLAAANGSNLQTSLKIGQTIKVPLTAQNFDQESKKTSGETLVPVYHVVAKNETLFRIGNNNNKVSLTSIKQWNNLPGDNVMPGQSLIVGHLKIRNEQLAALNAGVPVSQESEPAAPVSKPAASEPKKEGNTFTPTVAAEEKKPEAPPATKAPEEKNSAATPGEAAPEKKDEPVVKPTEVMGKKADAPAPKAVAESKPDLLAPTISNIPDEGFFATTFASDIADKKKADNTGEAGTFKSTSGWQNKKYYVLINNVEPGTILKITAAEKTVYAKVLGSLPDMKENSTLLLRVSNAAASYLGKVDPKFPVQVSYYQ